MNLQTHSITDWVRLRGGIKLSESTRDDTEIRHYCSRAEAGYNLLNSKRGRTLDELTTDAICEGWLPTNADQDTFLEYVGRDIQAKISGDVLARVYHFSHDPDLMLDELLEQWDPHMGDCCKSCGYWEAEELRLSASWREVVCEKCRQMLEGVCS